MATLAVPPVSSPLQRLWKRELTEYPTGGRRLWYLGIVVFTTVVVYYQTYVGGAVGAQILGDFHITFLTFALINALANAVGALASLAAGIADKVGRANLAVAGLIGCSLITLFWIPNTHSPVAFGIAAGVAGLLEGVILVATPALVRDFSPQVGRAQAMGFWTMGPVIGSLIVTEVSSNTLNHLPGWRDQYVIAGIVGLVACVLSATSLRELDAANRDRVIGAIEAETEAALVARGLTHEEATRKPLRQMLKPDIILSSLAISLFLLLYYTAVSFLPVFFQTVQGFTASQANSLLNWLWGSLALSMVFFGVLSDKLQVRKPFMLAGGLVTVVLDIAFLTKIDHTNPSYSSVAILLVFMGIWSGAAYVPWMASFTETVERRNPALSATGLAVWGWVLRCVVAAAVIVIPLLVSSTNPLVNDAPTVQARLAQFERSFPELAAEAQVHPEIFTQLGTYPDASKIPNSVIGKALRTVGPKALTQLQNPKAQADLKYLSGKTTTDVVKAKKDSPGQWKTWFWICTIGAGVFCPMIFLMAGGWRPRPQKDARAAAHALEQANRIVHDEAQTLAARSASPAPSVGSYQ